MNLLQVLLIFNILLVAD